MVLFDQLDPSGFIDAIAEERCTVALTVPTQLVMMTQASSWGRPLPHLRYFISGGDEREIADGSEPTEAHGKVFDAQESVLSGNCHQP